MNILIYFPRTVNMFDIQIWLCYDIFIEVVSMAKKKQDELEIVTGDGSELEFSAVYQHLNAVKSKPKDEKEKNKPIIIPEVKKKAEEKTE